MKEKKIEGIIRKRYSCRSYRDISLSENDMLKIEEYISQKITGPFGTSAGFKLIAAGPDDSNALKGLGTYGFVRNPAAFVAGVIKEPEMNLEDFGYAMERIILNLTEMELGSCWLGGSFKKSSFAEKAGITDDEIIPAVAAVGYAADKKTFTDRIIRATVGSAKRKGSDELFYTADLKNLEINADDGYGTVLEMVRLAPSASNKQPWRIIKEDGKNTFHFFMERSAGYLRQSRMIGGADLQRVDMGIAMCHFECSAIEAGLKGLWKHERPSGMKHPEGWEYSLTWQGK